MDHSGSELEGRINLGKSRKGDVPDRLKVSLRGRLLFELQGLLEGEVRKGGDYLRVRDLVLMAEEIRIAVAKATGKMTEEDAA